MNSFATRTARAAYDAVSRPPFPLQRKLAVGAADSPLEAQADRMAERVAAAPLHAASGGAAARSPSTRAAAISATQDAPRSVERVLASAGAPLQDHVQRDMEGQFGHDFSTVRVHHGSAAAQSAGELQARAYTVGNQLVFGAGQFAPATREGRGLLAHELTHVVQQGAGSRLVSRAPAKPPTIGSKFVPPTGAATVKSVSAQFDGQDFIVKDGTKVILSHAAQSGRPVPLRASDAAACGGSVDDSYLNNPRYVGIEDFGPIPEGDFALNLSEFSTFTQWEQAQMITGGSFTDPFGQALHGGDWGAGRAPLHPVKLLPSAAGCGDTARRSGFYLHGGSLPGSSGCIDIDNDGINSFLGLVGGYKATIPVKVKYTHPAPTVSGPVRGLGKFTYPTKDGKPIKDPSIWERFGAVLGSDDKPAAPKKAAPGATPKKKPRKKKGAIKGKTSSLPAEGDMLLAGGAFGDIVLDDEESAEA
jgi:hypothetical protein